MLGFREILRRLETAYFKTPVVYSIFLHERIFGRQLSRDAVIWLVEEYGGALQRRIQELRSRSPSYVFGYIQKNNYQGTLFFVQEKMGRLVFPSVLVVRGGVKYLERNVVGFELSEFEERIARKEVRPYYKSEEDLPHDRAASRFWTLSCNQLVREYEQHSSSRDIIVYVTYEFNYYERVITNTLTRVLPKYPGLLVLRIDGDKNDVPLLPPGFEKPSLYLFRAGTTNPILFKDSFSNQQNFEQFLGGDKNTARPKPSVSGVDLLSQNAEEILRKITDSEPPKTPEKRQPADNHKIEL